MGLYLRRSIRVGPLRFNFSTSGIGVSAGIPGFRIGTGPRGAYVHMGAGGLYYRQSLGNGGRVPRGAPSDSGRRAVVERPSVTPDDSLGPMREIDSATVLELTDSSSDELLQEIQRRQALPRIGPWVLGGSVALLFVLWGSGVRGIPFVLLLAGAGLAYWWARMRDALRRTVVVGYQLDEAAAGQFESLMSAIKALGEIGGLWHVHAEAEVHDRKYHAGASTVIKREAVRPGLGQPPIVRTNLDVPTLSVGRQRLYFFPDRLLVFEGSQVGAVGYDGLRVEIGTTRFIEDESVPPDAQVVDRTWRYVNKKGGPDRRFTNNQELPIALYETIHFRSASGLNELLHASRIGVGVPLAAALAAMGGLSRPAVIPSGLSPAPWSG